MSRMMQESGGAVNAPVSAEMVADLLSAWEAIKRETGERRLIVMLAGAYKSEQDEGADLISLNLSWWATDEDISDEDRARQLWRKIAGGVINAGVGMESITPSHLSVGSLVTVDADGTETVEVMGPPIMAITDDGESSVKWMDIVGAWQAAAESERQFCTALLDIFREMHQDGSLPEERLSQVTNAHDAYRERGEATINSTIDLLKSVFGEMAS